MKNIMFISLSFCTLADSLNAMHNAAKAKCSLNRQNQSKNITTAVKILTRQIEQAVLQTIDQTYQPNQIVTPQDNHLLRIILAKLAADSELDLATRARIQKVMPFKKIKKAKKPAILSEPELKEAAETEAINMPLFSLPPSALSVIAQQNAPDSTNVVNSGESEAEAFEMIAKEKDAVEPALTETPTPPSSPELQPTVQTSVTETQNQPEAQAVPTEAPVSGAPERYFLNPLRWLGL